MSGKKITEREAADTLAQCKASPADILFVDERPKKLQEAVAKGATSADMAKSVGVPVNVASCAAVAYGLEEPGIKERAGAWVGGLMSSFKNAADKAGETVSNKIDASLKAAQPGTAPGVTERGASMDQFCATVEANGGSGRDVRLAEQKCEGPKAKAFAM